MIKKILFVSFLLFTNRASAQSEENLLIAKKYQEESAVFLSKSEIARIDIVNDSLVILNSIHEKQLLLDDNANLFSPHQISFSSFTNISGLEATSYVPHNGRYKKFKVDHFTTSDVPDSDVFHDDIRTTAFNYPSLIKNSITELKYTEEIKEARFFGSFYFGSYIPSINSTLEINIDTNVKLDYILFGVEEDKLNLTKTFIKDRVLYKWEMKDLEKIGIEQNAPNVRYFTPHIIVRIASFKTSGKEVKVLHELKDLYAWYASMLKNVGNDASPELAQLVDSILTEDMSEFEKVKTVFYWVQDNVKYIAIEDGLEGFVPRDASLVCERRYGDCKDMSSLIHKMLSLAGVKSYLAWIGTRDIPYKYTELPTPFVDNHMITVYEIDDQRYFLDATGKHTPMGFPSSFILGKEALLNISDDEYRVVEVPELSANNSIFEDVVELDINDDKLTGKGKTNFSGYFKILMAGSLNDRDPIEQARMLTAYYNKGNNKFIIDGHRVNNLTNRDTSLNIDYDFRLDNYMNKLNDKIYINLNLDRVLEKESMKSDRKQGFLRKFKGKRNYKVILNLPDGYQIEYIPPNVNHKSSTFGFDLQYSQVGNTIVLDLEVLLDYLLLETTEFSDWNDMVSKLNEAYREALILKKMNTND